jgi:hypothetical protein
MYTSSIDVPKLELWNEIRECVNRLLGIGKEEDRITFDVVNDDRCN